MTLCASITCITCTYAKPEGRVIFDHRHNAAVRYIYPPGLWSGFSRATPAPSTVTVGLGADQPIAKCDRVAVSNARTEPFCMATGSPVLSQRGRTE